MGELWALTQAFERASARSEDRLGVSAQQRLMLRFVGRHAGITPSQLARMLLREGRAVSDALRRLVEKGLVTRAASDVDRRVVLLHLTPSGRRLDRKDSASLEAALDAVSARIGDDGVATVRRFIGGLATELDRRASAPRTRVAAPRSSVARKQR